MKNNRRGARLEELSYAIDCIAMELKQLGNHRQHDMLMDAADQLSDEAQFLWDNRGMEIGVVHFDETNIIKFSRFGVGP